MKDVVTAVVVTLMVTLVACQFQGRIPAGLNAGTDDSDKELRLVLSDSNITGFVDCMIRPWDIAKCGARAPIMSTMIKWALKDNLQCPDCSSRVKDQMNFIHTRLKEHKPQCDRLLRGIRFGKLIDSLCETKSNPATDASKTDASQTTT